VIKIEVIDTETQALFVRLRDAATNMRPLMQELGEQLTETTKQRFQTSTAPDGSRWAPNAESTYVNLAGKYKSGLDKKGRVTKSGAARLAGKKPLIGETRALSTTINYRASSDYVEIGSPMVYAGVQQFGAAKHSFAGGKTPWADIPARPFLGLSVADQGIITKLATRHLEKAIKG
jgi:phage virion morphogenesis protein